MGAKKDKRLVREALTRSLSMVYPSVEAFEKELLSGRRLSFYFGIDPTSSHLHLGHAAGLWTLRRFQDLGHKAILLIGDFTARVGDPTDKMAPRQPLTPKQIKENWKTFKKQVSRILNFSGENAAQVRYNSEWFGKMKFEDFFKSLLGAFSVQNLLERADFKKRLEEHKSIELREFIYPLLQGWDGRELGVNVEIGGRDQIFNMNVGRAFRDQVWKDNFFVAVKLLVDSNTGKKLSKTEASLVNLDDSPGEMFGRVMAMPDGMISGVAELSTSMPLDEIRKLKEFDNPRDAKLALAFEVVKTYCSEKNAEKARKDWKKIFSERDVNNADIPYLEVGKLPLLDVVLKTGVVKSKSEARRLIAQGGVHVEGAALKDPHMAPSFSGGETIRVGKRHFFRAKVK